MFLELQLPLQKDRGLLESYFSECVAVNTEFKLHHECHQLNGTLLILPCHLLVNDELNDFGFRSILGTVDCVLRLLYLKM